MTSLTMPGWESNPGPWFIEAQAFSPSYDLAPPPLPSASCLIFSVFLSVARGAYWDDWGGEGSGRGAKWYDDEKAWSSINHSILSVSASLREAGVLTSQPPPLQKKIHTHTFTSAKSSAPPPPRPPLRIHLCCEWSSLILSSTKEKWRTVFAQQSYTHVQYRQQAPFTRSQQSTICIYRRKYIFTIF